MSDARGRGVARQVHSGGQARPAARKAKIPAAGWHQRFSFIIAFVLASLIGLPLANALLGEIAAMVLAAFMGGFAVGRMRLKRR
ncbi:MAG: hypothetical protein FJX33_04685 [Alphaproteobacteria bacterium]|nr:hypothetical protein [Alphaproteobacteria bacterium]